MISRNDNCWCGSGKKWKKCHFPNPGQDLYTLYKKKFDILIKTPEQIEKIRAACRLTSKILDETCAIAKAGVMTQELNDFANAQCVKAGVTAASLHYGQPPFPKSICTSLNEVICHGIPHAEKLQEGDIVNVDIACILNGYYGDCSKMVSIGTVSEEKKRVVDVSYESLMRSIAILKPGIPVSAIGEVIEAYATSHRCSVVDHFVGHGVGIRYHEGPQVHHNYNCIDIPLIPGMIFTIEPMINAGVREGILDPHDHWTVRTRDGKPSAQFEHTVLITDNGHEILTNWTR